MGVHNLNSKDDFKAALADPSPLLIDCFATWCGPCKVIAPHIANLSNEHTSMRFYKLDVDEVPDVAQELGVRAMPTFILFKDGEKVGEIVGANQQAITAAVLEHIPSEKSA
ncbi:Cytoplasmic thioredoxin isoenzyme 2 [Pseudocyphellaria aurata]|nr:Cytoplasmic thioredoxin isoenzyme 2 [Pseudocyphellaria aurata]